MMRIFCRAIVAVVICHSVAGRTVGDTPSPSKAPANSSNGPMLLMGLRDHRDRLRQGIVEAKGEQRVGSASRPVRLAVVFDLDRGLLRSEYTEYASRANAEQSKNDHDAKKHLKEQTIYYIHRPEASIVFNRVSDENRPGNIVISSPDKPVSPALHSIDPRAIGLITSLAYSHPRSFSDLIELYAAKPPDETTDEGAGLWRLTWMSATSEYRQSLWIDRSRGFSPSGSRSVADRPPQRRRTLRRCLGRRHILLAQQHGRKLAGCGCRIHGVLNGGSGVRLIVPMTMP